MPKAKKILLVDNVPSFSETCADYLARRGYEVKTVASPEACWQALEEEPPHLLILDIRLREEHAQDFSGLLLAKELGPYITKIMLTSYPSWEVARDSLTYAEGTPPAAFFVSKGEGLPALFNYVELAFAEHVRLNWDLQIEWKDRDPFSLVRLIEPALPAEHLPARAEEIDNLLRKLFLTATQITIERLWWQRPQRAALQVAVIGADQTRQTCLVVYGDRATIEAEEQRYRQFAPSACATSLQMSGALPHYAGNVYALAGCDFAQVQPLNELYRTDAKLFSVALTALYEQVLPAWALEQHESLTEQRSLADRYHRHPAFAGAPATAEALAETLTVRIQALLRQLPLLGFNAALRDGVLNFRIAGETLVGPDPARFVQTTTPDAEPALLVNTPGAFGGEAILTNSEAQVWLTDFSAAGPSPAVWNYAALEAAMRFDWLEACHPKQLREFTQEITDETFLRFNPGDYERELQRPARAVKYVRQTALNQPGYELRAYQQCLFFHALHRLTKPLPAHPSKHELTRAAHALLSAALMAEQFAQWAMTPPLKVSGLTGLQLDDRNFAALIDGSRVELAEQGFELLSLLKRRAPEVCTRREIIEQVFKTAYEPGDLSQTRQIDTAISRLRAEIEFDPQNPRFLHTIRSRGYRLTPDA